MFPENSISSKKEEVKRRFSAQLNSFPSINPLPNNLNNLNFTYKSTNDLSRAKPFFKSNSLFAYQELDKFSSFCDDNSIQSEFLSDCNKKNNQVNNINNNNSTKLEECEHSDSDNEYSDNNNEMSEDELFYKKYNQRMEKRKSAFHSYPVYLQNLSALNKQNDSHNNNNFSNSDKKRNKNEINNNVNNNSNFMLINNNIPNNIRRKSQPINQFKNTFYNNILFQNNNNNTNYILPTNIIDNTNNNNSNNNFINNNIGNINNNPNMNYIQNIQNLNPTLTTNLNNFQNFNFIQTVQNFYNNPSQNYINNNNLIISPNPFSKKRNSQIYTNQNRAPQISQERRLSGFALNSNCQIKGNENQLDKVKLNEENPNYFLSDQFYCRQIQSKLDKNINNPKYSEEFYENIKPQLIDVINHKFGNYVMQKFLSVLLSQENKIILEDIFIQIKEQLFSICIDNYGTRVIQKTLERLDEGNYSKIETEKINSVFKSLIENHLYELCCDKNGNHVYQKLLTVFPKDNNKNDFLFDELIKISFKVSILQQGASLLEKAFINSNKEQRQRLCQSIIERISDLINEKYGNFTIQVVFKLFEENINEKIYKYIDDNIINLSKEKFSSNVIDKCFIKDYDKSIKLIESIIQKNIIKEMIIDPFGNYIVQKAMSVSEPETIEKIAEQIKPMLGELQKTNRGKKIYEKLWSNYKDYLK